MRLHILETQVRFMKNFFLITTKLMEYIFSAVKVCSNPCVGPIPKTNKSFFLSTPKINTFWPNSPPGNEKLPLLSNPVP